MKPFLFPLTTALAIAAAAPAETTSSSVQPSRETIAKHIDPDVQVNGKYAAVRLPITRGPDLWNPSRVSITPEGLVFIANYTGEILTLHDTNADGLEDTTRLFVDVTQINKPIDAAPPEPGKIPDGPQLRYPTAMTYKDGWLYVGTTRAIHRFKVSPDGKLAATELFASGWPYTMHAFDWTFGLRFGKDGWLYAVLCTDYLNPEAAPDPDGLRGSMIRISPDGKKIERFASGLRYAYGIAINEAGDVFFTDNRGGKQNVTEELNHAIAGGNYGHKPKNPNSPAIEPILSIQTNASPTGCAFNPTHNTNFGDTAGDLFIACWGNDGAWNKGGIAHVQLTQQADGSYQAVEKTLSNGPAKITDLAFHPSGDMYVARFGREARAHAPHPTPEGGVYRYIHVPWITPQRTVTNPLLALSGNPKQGKKVFIERSCATCHSVDRSSSMLGPDLMDIALTMNRQGLLESINQPAANIKTDYETTRITTKNGAQLLGCVVSSDAEHVVLKMPGNIEKKVEKSHIAETQILPISLMPAGLLNDASQQEKNDLFAYLESLAIDRTVRLNAGGPTVKVNNHTYLADTPYTPGGFGYIDGATASTLNRSKNQTLTSCRHGDFSYRFDCSNGDYDVTLTFAEHWLNQPGQRVFSVLLNEQPVLNNLDLVTHTGSQKPFTKTFRVTATQGHITLTTDAESDHAILNAIEVRAAAETP
jgi:putative heme-binding domain-containing protein